MEMGKLFLLFSFGVEAFFAVGDDNLREWNADAIVIEEVEEVFVHRAGDAELIALFAVGQ